MPSGKLATRPSARTKCRSGSADQLIKQAPRARFQHPLVQLIPPRLHKRLLPAPLCATILSMELREQLQRPTLAERVGDVTHASALLRRLRRISGCAAADLPAWLLRCAVERGASHYRRHFDATLPADQPSLTCEEIGVALCLAHHPFDATLIRAAAQLLSAPGTAADVLVHLAVMERCEPVLLHIADAAGRVAPALEPWRALRDKLPRRHRVRLDALPHWSRFVLQTGYTRAGRGQHIAWL